jgi:vibriolysin
MALTVQLFTATSGVAQAPSVELTVPGDHKIIGGGATDNWSGFGNLLTATYPMGPQTWFAAGKAHKVSSPASITAYALALFDPDNEWDVIIKQETSDPAPHPQAVATLPAGYTLTGGGAFVDWHGFGNLLTTSFPTSELSWEARSKDHDTPDPSRITAYAIGVKPRSGNLKLQTSIVKSTGGRSNAPHAVVCLDPGWILSGGGALDQWDGFGNLLTASSPGGMCWLAAGKAHVTESPAAITVYAIGIRTA